MNLNIEIVNFDESVVLKRYREKVDSEKSVGALKQIVAAKCDGAVVALRCRGMTLDLGKTFAGNGVRDGDEIKVVTDVREASINVMVQLASSSHNNKPSYVASRPSATTEEFMAAVKRYPTFNLPDCYLTCNGQSLRPGVTLRDQNVGDNSVVNVCVRTRGG